MRVDWLRSGPDKRIPLADGMEKTPIWGQVADSVHEAMRDGRWSVGTLLCTRGELILAALTTLQSTKKLLPDANVRQELASAFFPGDQPDGRDILFLGGLAHLRGGFTFLPGLDDAARLLTASLILESAWQSTAGMFAALYVPDSQAALMGQAGPHFGPRRAGPEVAVLDIPAPAVSEDDFIDSLRRSARRSWRRDRQRFSESRIRAVETVVTPDLLAEAAPLIVAVKARNQIPDHPRITRLRLDAWLSRTDTRLVRAWTCRNADGELIGISVGIRHDRLLRMVEIGLSDSSPERGDLYLELEFHAPLRTCLDEGVEGIDLGSGHLDPKLRRGAGLRPQWHYVGTREPIPAAVADRDTAPG